ncbi:hypothetical protein ACY2LX_003587 [Acinetobacter baumannii]|uniref:hypothetical protein n=2 Tax=Acinetobacter baumannii TaxID=470 RepID=UPI0004D373B8|nr:hypothetical protein [Acinetobacter baumannii]EHZ8847591.1 hypothetical protein [Acinetobacter baumannii]EIJ5840388.1 hypothetical protein [Acinetobacter baumannii]EIT1517795.1 hypothetical protein [Acinetobacter baumannii]EIT1736134.1 hypothetical protein [Acinetobacter baumannii]EIT1748829.1 hypothetical protein [Acinetobacter baumannii]
MIPNDQSIKHFPVEKLFLDPLNPRLGESAGETITQEQIISLIINDFGIDDLLSSMAFNGYFDAEPLVCQERDGQLFVIEGNRRLVTSLILSGDHRAKEHAKNFNYFTKLHQEKGSPNVSRLPVVIFPATEEPKRISAYLGIRHIVSTKDWDSFAKARWIHETIINQNISIKDISTMTGDKSGTIKSLLSGYNFMTQLEQEKKFNRNNTIRKGRGSNVSYPFSWVYTLFNYPSARNYLNLSFFDENEQPNPKPIPQERLDDALFVVDAMFGNSSKGKDALLSDSRELPKFAEALGNPEKVYFLKKGKSLKEVNTLTTDINTRLENIFFECIELLEDGSNRITKEPKKITKITITESEPKIVNINNLLKKIKQQFIDIQKDDTNDLDL